MDRANVGEHVEAGQVDLRVQTGKGIELGGLYLSRLIQLADAAGDHSAMQHLPLHL